MENHLSLYEYLGKPAGSKLGKEVYAAAKAKGIRATSHEVENQNYSGLILKYPVTFLDEYFKKPNQTVQEILDDELPF